MVQGVGVLLRGCYMDSCGREGGMRGKATRGQWQTVYKSRSSIPSDSGRCVRQAQDTCPRGLASGKMPSRLVEMASDSAVTLGHSPIKKLFVMLHFLLDFLRCLKHICLVGDTRPRALAVSMFGRDLG